MRTGRALLAAAPGPLGRALLVVIPRPLSLSLSLSLALALSLSLYLYISLSLSLSLGPLWALRSPRLGYPIAWCIAPCPSSIYSIVLSVRKLKIDAIEN